MVEIALYALMSMYATVKLESEEKVSLKIAAAFDLWL